LDLETRSKFREEDNLRLAKASETLTGELLKRGYDVFGSSYYVHCVPESIIVGADSSKHKNISWAYERDFAELSEKLGLKFNKAEDSSEYVKKREYHYKNKFLKSEE